MQYLSIVITEFCNFYFCNFFNSAIFWIWQYLDIAKFNIWILQYTNNWILKYLTFSISEHFNIWDIAISEHCNIYLLKYVNNAILENCNIWIFQYLFFFYISDHCTIWILQYLNMTNLQQFIEISQNCHDKYLKYTVQ